MESEFEIEQNKSAQKWTKLKVMKRRVLLAEHNKACRDAEILKECFFLISGHQKQHTNWKWSPKWSPVLLYNKTYRDFFLNGTFNVVIFRFTVYWYRLFDSWYVCTLALRAGCFSNLFCRILKYFLIHSRAFHVTTSISCEATLCLNFYLFRFHVVKRFTRGWFVMVYIEFTSCEM